MNPYFNIDISDRNRRDDFDTELLTEASIFDRGGKTSSQIANHMNELNPVETELVIYLSYTALKNLPSDKFKEHKYRDFFMEAWPKAVELINYYIRNSEILNNEDAEYSIKFQPFQNLIGNIKSKIKDDITGQEYYFSENNFDDPETMYQIFYKNACPRLIIEFKSTFIYNAYEKDAENSVYNLVWDIASVFNKLRLVKFSYSYHLKFKNQKTFHTLEPDYKYTLVQPKKLKRLSIMKSHSDTCYDINTGEEIDNDNRFMPIESIETINFNEAISPNNYNQIDDNNRELLYTIDFIRIHDNRYININRKEKRVPTQNIYIDPEDYVIKSSNSTLVYDGNTLSAFKTCAKSIIEDINNGNVNGIEGIGIMVDYTQSDDMINKALMNHAYMMSVITNIAVQIDGMVFLLGVTIVQKQITVNPGKNATKNAMFVKDMVQKIFGNSEAYFEFIENSELPDEFKEAVLKKK